MTNTATPAARSADRAHAWRHGRTVPFAAAREAFARGAMTPRAFLEECLAVIEAREPTVKAFTVLDIEGARRAADESTARWHAGRPLSPLDGCPVGIKDIIETEDMPTGFGNPAFAGTRTGRDAASVQALRAGGAVIVGKTVTTEFAIGFSGPTTNPFDPERSPGGSSSGSAAAVGGGMLPVALGTQTQGSVLRPASFCGTVGFKPTLGALPIGGVHPLSASHDHLGVLGATLEDTWLAASHMALTVGNAGCRPLAGASYEVPAPVKPRRLIRLFTSAWENEVDDGTRAAMEEMIAALRSEGVVILDRDNDPAIATLEANIESGVADSLDMVAYDMKWPYTGYVARHGERIGERIRGLVERSRSITAERYVELLAVRERVRASVRAAVAEADGFVTMAASGPAPVGLAWTGSRSYLAPWSWLGFPAFSLPLMAVDGLPVGLQLMHADHQDATLCGLAHWMVRRFG